MAEPRNITVSGKARGLNGRLSVRGMDPYYVRVETISAEVRITSEEAESAQSKTFYPRQFSEGGFTLRLVFRDSDERDQFNKWMRRYMEAASRNQVGIMLVSVPARRFVRKAVPQGTLNYGGRRDDIGGSLLRRLTITFTGASDPSSRSSLSRFQNTNDPDARYFYPAGEQRSGPANLEALLFDTAPTAGAIGSDSSYSPSPGPGAPSSDFGFRGGQ